MLKTDRETTIRWNAEDNIAQIWTNDPAMIARMDVLCTHKSGAYMCVGKIGQGANYRVSAKMISFRFPTTDELTEEIRKKAKAKATAKRTRSK